MKPFAPWILAAALSGLAGAVHAQLRLLPAVGPAQVFGGGLRPIPLVWHNDAAQPFTGDIQARLLQTSSATVAPVSETPWKKLTVLPQQTVLESASFDFPVVRVETMFLIQWLEYTNRILGQTEVLVYPTNLLADLKPLAGNEPLGIFDPGNVLKPLLKSAQVDFADLEESSIADFRGRLAIIGPFATRQQQPGWLTERIKKLASKNVGIVWLLPPPAPYDRLQSSFYPVPSGTNAVIVVSAGLVAGLADQPSAQLRLLQLGRLALNPEPVALPVFTVQP